MGDDTFGASLRRLRNARGLSLRQLSALAHLDYGYLSKIENDLRPPTDAVANAVDIALEGDGDLIAIAQIQRANQGRQAVAFDPVRRREFVTAGVATAVASLSGVRDSTKRVGQVGVNDANRLQRAVARLRSLGHQHGGANLWQAAEGLAREGYHLLEQGSYTDQVGDLLLIATGQAQMCAGWLAFDSGQQDVARSCYNEAFSLARQTGSPGIEVHALANLAYQSSFLGMPRQALRFAEVAEQVAKCHDPRGKMAVVPHIRRATAFAIAGDRTDSDKAMTSARKSLDAARPDNAEDWCSFVSQAELDGLEATTAMKLGDFRRAESYLLRAIPAHDDSFARNRVGYRVRLARVRLELKEVDGAALAANEALDDLNGEVESWVVSGELREVAARFAEYRRCPEVARFISRYVADRT